MWILTIEPSYNEGSSKKKKKKILCQVSSCGYLWIHRFIQKIFTEELLCSRPESDGYTKVDQKDKKNFCLHRVFILKDETVNKHKK